MQSETNELSPRNILNAQLQNFSAIVNAMIERSIDDMNMEIVINNSLADSVNQRTDTTNIKTDCIKFSDISDNTITRCMICLLDFKNDDKVQYLPCQHIFHHECINEWVKYKNECPTCRNQIETEEEEREEEEREEEEREEEEREEEERQEEEREEEERQEEEREEETVEYTQEDDVQTTDNTLLNFQYSINLSIECEQCGETFNEADFLEHECQ